MDILLENDDDGIETANKILSIMDIHISMQSKSAIKKLKKRKVKLLLFLKGLLVKK